MKGSIIIITEHEGGNGVSYTGKARGMHSGYQTGSPRPKQWEIMGVDTNTTKE